MTQKIAGRKIRETKLGPVDDLEKYLKPDWWKRIFNSMYLRTDADVVEDREITSCEVDMFHNILQPDKQDLILDLACGQGRHLIEFARRGFVNLCGLDRSHYLISKAKSIIAKEGFSVTFKEGDARKLPYQTDNFDFVLILGNSFGYFESLDDDVKILNEIFRVLKPGGRFLIDVADGNFLKSNYQPRSWEWIDKKHFVCRERSLSSDNQRLISREVISNIDKGVIVDQFYAERLYTHDMLRSLLKDVGFREIQFHREMIPESKRNQDLGMMERRLACTASVIKEWSPRKIRKKLKHVVVLLGDPKINDRIKPDGIFDDDDYNTIDQLRIALSKLEDFRFTYLDNHPSLISDLQKLKGKTDFVFNLCDEGFGNEATKELHVPALLEMLEIPCTGSNPQCLAYCYDKSLIRGIAKEMEVPVANGFFIKPGDDLFELNLRFPVIVKPNFGDSSFGITMKNVASSIEQLNDAIIWIRTKFGYDKPILVEEFLTGPELSVGIIGNPPDDHSVLPVIEEDYSKLPPELPKICGYEAKWLPGSPYFRLLRSVPANISEDLRQHMIDCCFKLFERLECRDYCRFDWRLNKSGHPRLLEVNPNPGWCWDGHLAKMALLNSMDYSQLLEALLTAAENRIFMMKSAK